MKAIYYDRYGSSDVLKLKEVEKPVPKDDEVLIKVRSTSINDWDWGLVTGKPFIMRLLNGLSKPKVKIPGVDVAGIVEEVGENVKVWKPGDEVYGDLSESGFGAFAEYVCAKENAVVKIPEKMTFEKAAALPHASMLALQALQYFDRGFKDKHLLVNGAGGGVGTLVLNLINGKEMKSTAVDSGEKLEMLRSIGYDEVIDYKKTDFTENKNSYDYILDVKTNRSVLKYVRSLKRGGKYITVGGSIPLILLITIIGPFIKLFIGKTIAVLALKPNKGLEKINNMYAKGRINPIIEGPYKLEEVPALLQRFGEGKHKGKIVVNLV